jgi:hypothetical protein
MMGSSNFGMAAFVPTTAAAHDASRSLVRDPENSNVRASICRTERQATCPASQPTQTNAPDLQSTFGHRPCAHHAGAAVLARSNGGETASNLLEVPGTVTSLFPGASSPLHVDLIPAPVLLPPIVALSR